LQSLFVTPKSERILFHFTTGEYSVFTGDQLSLMVVVWTFLDLPSSW